MFVSRGQAEVNEKSSMFVGDESKTATQPVCVSSVEGNEDVLQTQQQHQNLSLSFNSSHASVSGESEADNEAMSPASGCASTRSSPTLSTPSTNSGHDSPLKSSTRSVMQASAEDNGVVPIPFNGPCQNLSG